MPGHSISDKLHRWVCFIALTVFFLMSFTLSAGAADQCPHPKDHKLAKIHYQLFTAYNVAYEGYAVVCENKCFTSEPCTQNCQEEKGLVSLEQKLKELNASMPGQTCMSHSLVCLEQCKKPWRSLQTGLWFIGASG